MINDFKELMASTKKNRGAYTFGSQAIIYETVTLKLGTEAYRGTGPPRSLVCVEVLGQVLEDMTYELENISVVGV